jgi:GNAT superfamily N-acetyltransferase
MDIYLATIKEVQFVFDCFKELRGKAQYTLGEFTEYFKHTQSSEPKYNGIHVIRVNDELVGIATLNRFSLPRYLGFCVEIEDLILVESARGKKYGELFMNELIKACEKDKSIRRVMCKTDNQYHAERIYSKMYTPKELYVFFRPMNQI